MENSLAQSLFVEFYGLPGCGKSTISHILANRLMDDGFAVEEPSFTEDHRPKFARKILKLLYGCYGFVFHYSTYRRIVNLVYENGYMGYEKFTQTVNVLQKVNVYRKENSKKIVIWDQGIIQAAISLSINKQISAFDNLIRIEDIISKDVIYYRVFIPVERSVVLERMKKRNTNDSRVEKIEGETKKMNFLKLFEDGIYSIRKGLVAKKLDIILDEEGDVNILADKVYRRVTSVLADLF